MALVWKHTAGSLGAYPSLKVVASNCAAVDFIIDDSKVPNDTAIMRIVDTKLADDMSEHVLSVIMAYLKNLDYYMV